MKASVLDFRRRMGDILRALDQNESVTILYRGKKKGVILPAGISDHKGKTALGHPAFGIWKDRRDMRDVDAVIGRLRKGRRHAV